MATTPIGGSTGHIRRSSALAKSQERIASSLDKLGSQKRVNTASDDVSASAIAEKLTALEAGLRQSSRNANDAVSLVQVADSGLGEIDSALTRMRELAIQGANGGTLSPDQRASIDQEYQMLADEVSRIADTTEFNGQKLLDGSSGSVTFQIGPNNSSDDRLEVGLGDATAASLGIDAGSVDLGTEAGARSAIDAFDTARQTVSTSRSELGASTNRLESIISESRERTINTSDARSRLEDADVAEETANLAQERIKAEANIALTTQAASLSAASLSLLG